MNCNQIRELLPDLAAGMEAASTQSEVNEHIASCKDCAIHLSDLQKTMAVLDEWQAPEPSPYFDTRLQARFREERRKEEVAHPAAAWFHWLYRPVWAGWLAAIIFAAALLVGNRSYFAPTESIATKPPSLSLPVEPGTAVGDLQALDRNDDLYADFDMLDDLQVQDDVTANP